ncbi:hypothetical protein HanRHA438_Chr16g0771881 [Helianthus annuus]|nr:hypothetical protein HanRHA438_Chr16g0771881 [Helianthus annuus]
MLQHQRHRLSKKCRVSIKERTPPLQLLSSDKLPAKLWFRGCRSSGRQRSNTSSETLM